MGDCVDWMMTMMHVRARPTKTLFGRVHRLSNVGKNIGRRVSNAEPSSVAAVVMSSTAAADRRDRSDKTAALTGWERDLRASVMSWGMLAAPR